MDLYCKLLIGGLFPYWAFEIRKIYTRYILRRLEFDRILATPVIDMYSKCGSLSSSHTRCARVNTRDLISWNAITANYGIHGAEGKHFKFLSKWKKQS